MKFCNKILLAIWGVVLSLLVITFFIINYWMRSRIEETFSDELRRAFSTLLVNTSLQSEILRRASQVIAESPRLRAVVELRDPRTAYQLSQEINQTTASDLFVLTDLRGRPLVQMLQGQRQEWDLASFQSVKQAMRQNPATDIWMMGGHAFRVASVPILVDRDLIGTLTMGFTITQTEIHSLQSQVNSQIVLAQGNEILLSTLDPGQGRTLLTAWESAGALVPPAPDDTMGRVFKVSADNESYVGTVFRLNRPGQPDGVISYLLVKPVEDELNRSLKPILGTFGIVSVIFLALTTIIGHVISLGITKPINALVQGTSEVSKGNYDYGITVAGRDELSFLAQKFGEMSRSLKEKITELDRLNKDLVARNRDLDETLRQLKEAQDELLRSERLAATGKLTAQLAHEINNPIHNIQSCLKTSLGRLPGETQGRELIEIAYDEISRMSKLTRQLLDFYRGSLVPDEARPIRLNDVLREVLAAFAEEFTRSKIEIVADFELNLPEVGGSADKLKQVFINTILNARDAMLHGGLLRLATREEWGAVKVLVTDTGIGIPKENLSKIFDAFFTTKGKVSGVGLGLSVSYGIINQHRGTISVESTVGKGTTFTISLPSLRATVPSATSYERETP
jgi:signal transduction histidine kinase